MNITLSLSLGFLFVIKIFILNQIKITEEKADLKKTKDYYLDAQK